MKLEAPPSPAPAASLAATWHGNSNREGQPGKVIVRCVSACLRPLCKPFSLEVKGALGVAAVGAAVAAATRRKHRSALAGFGASGPEEQLV